MTANCKDIFSPLAQERLRPFYPLALAKKYPNAGKTQFRQWVFLQARRWRNKETGYDIRTIQELLDHNDVKTTMIYTHVLNRGSLGIQSPIDRM